MTSKDNKPADSGRGDGVGQPQVSGRSAAGESGGGAYPNPHSGKKSDNHPSSFMGHGGQSEMAYHGTGQLGEEQVDEKANPNAPAK